MNPGIDPKYVFWLGVVVSVELGIGQGAVPLSDMFPADLVHWIKGWSAGLAFVGTTIMTGLSGYSSKMAGPFIKSIVLVAVMLAGLLSFGDRAIAADVAIKAPAFTAPPPNCQSSANCSGWYADFGLLNENANIISGGLNGATNDFGLMVGGGYQLWQGPILAGLQLNGGYEFANQGASMPGSHFLGTALVQLGYNFFPSSASAPTTPGQSPWQSLVPANLLAASTPYINAGGCLRHGIVQGCAGVGIQTVIAAGWSTAFDYVNMPSQKGQPDNQVFMLKVLKHF